MSEWTAVPKAQNWSPVAGTQDPEWDITKAVKGVGKAAVPSTSLGDIAEALPKAVLGGAEAVVGGALETGRAIGGGIFGLGAAALGGGFRENFEKYNNATEFISNVAAPETETGKALFNLLAQIPNYAHKAGEATFKYTDSPLAGAGVEGIANALAFLGAFRAKGGEGAKAQYDTAMDAFKQMAENDPEKAIAVVEKAGDVDPKLAKELTERIKSITPDKAQVKGMWTKVITDSKKAEQAEKSQKASVVTKDDVDKMFDASKLVSKEESPRSQTPIVEKAAADLRNTQRAADEVEPPILQPGLKQKAVNTGKRGFRQGGAVFLGEKSPVHTEADFASYKKGFQIHAKISPESAIKAYADAVPKEYLDAWATETEGAKPGYTIKPGPTPSMEDLAEAYTNQRELLPPGKVSSAMPKSQGAISIEQMVKESKEHIAKIEKEYGSTIPKNGKASGADQLEAMKTDFRKVANTAGMEYAHLAFKDVPDKVRTAWARELIAEARKPIGGPGKRAFKQGGAIGYVPEDVPTMPTDILKSIRFADRHLDPVEGIDIEKLTQKIRSEGFDPKQPVTVLVSTHDNMAFLQDGNHRVTAAVDLNIPDVPVRIETTDRPFTEEQRSKARPVGELPIRPEMYPKPNRTPQEQADFEEMQRLMQKDLYGGLEPGQLLGGVGKKGFGQGGAIGMFDFKADVAALKSIKSKVEESWTQLLRNMNVEGLGEEARKAAAIVANNDAIMRRANLVAKEGGKARTRFWDKAGAGQGLKFIVNSESGKPFADPYLEAARKGYKQGYEQIYQHEVSKGIQYTPRDNYITHIFEEDPRLEQFMQQKYGPKWGNPSFIKERGYEMYTQAMEAGFRPKYTNPEDIYQARMHASSVATMRIDTLEDLKAAGIAREAGKGDKIKMGEREWRAPNGKRYFVGNQANSVLEMAFDNKSLWSLKGIPGMAFRGMVGLKNTLVPPLLFLSGFHPLHVLGIDIADTLAVAERGALKGKTTVDAWTNVLNGVYRNPKSGSRIIDLYKGKVPEGKMTEADRQALQYMMEGGFSPLQDSHYRINAKEGFRRMLDQHRATAVFRAPFALMETLQSPIFEKWIPNLKAASYLRNVQQILRDRPELLDDKMARIQAFRQIQKSVDNRYGEMNYNTLFWNKWIKDLGVASTLSMGWELGFIREYGGAVIESGRAITEKAGLRPEEAIPRDKMNKALFVGTYTATAFAVGGLMTYLLSGQTPQNIYDYTNPRTGETDANGKPKRVSTMYYTREFVALGKEAETEGVAGALGHYVTNKAAPSLGLVKALATNLDYFNHEISDPNAPMLTRVGQQLEFVFKAGTPISLQDRGTTMTPRDKTLAFLGFSPAPAYVSETPTEAKIKSVFHKYHGTITPYDKAEYGLDNKRLREYFQSGDVNKYSEQLQKMRQKYNLSSRQVDTLKKNIRVDASVKMFKALSSAQQLQILKSMSEEEVQKYFPHASKEAQRLLRAEQ